MAEQVAEIFTEVVIAPGFEDGAVDVLAAKKNIRLLECASAGVGGIETRSISGGLLMQARDAIDAAGDAVGSWLYGVAYNTARKLRQLNARRALRETPLADRPEPLAASDSDSHPELVSILDEELGRLPEHYAIEGMPSSVLLAPDGRVLHRHSGFRSADAETYEAAIRAALPLQEARR